MSSELNQIYEQYCKVPHSSIASNEPYGPRPMVAEDKAERAIAKRNFLRGVGEWPDISYPQLDTPSLDESESQYQSLLEAIMDAEQREGETPESNALYESSARKLAEVYRHMEVRRRLGGFTLKRTEMMRQRAGNMSAELFGEVDEEKFAAQLQADIRIAVEQAEKGSPEKQTVTRELLGLLRVSPERTAEILSRNNPDRLELLHPEAIRVIRQDLYTIFPTLELAMNQFAGRTELTPATEGELAFVAALNALGLTKKSWKVEVLPNSSSAETHAREQTITFGEKRADFTPDAIVTVPIHEALHAYRAQSSKELGLPMLPGAVAFDEGLATAVEQVVSGKTRIPGEKYFIQLGLLKGLFLPEDEREEQSYRTVHEIMWRRAALREESELTPGRVSALQSAAYGPVMRTARGNARDNRDISYFIGGQKAMPFLNETARLSQPLRLQRLKWVLSGVFDPTVYEQAKLYGGDPAKA
jgi:hypothetical protein